ncbi:Baseplate assembly protein J [Neorhizobium galegae bv. officinalis]|nr:Baseplate assembly protein J [Neorhizobium galegae bv. officinalis]
MAGSLDLTTLSAPTVIEELDNEQIIARQKALFAQLWEVVRVANPLLDLPPYDVAMLETDPIVIGNEGESYRETLLRARINEAARANLLAFARKGDLDHLAAFYDVLRMLGEEDDRLVARVILAIQGRSTGGTEPRYKFIAMSADLRVQDAIVYTVGRSPLIHVAVFSTAPDGVAPSDLLAIVNAALQNPDVRMVNDTIEVASAVQQVVNLAADIWLLPDADVATVSRAETNLRTTWAAARALGRDLTVSWWTAQLMIPGVHRVAATSPVGDAIAPPASAISIGTVILTNRGRAF